MFIFYAILAEQSVGALFIAGILPGLLVAGLMMGVIYLQVKLNPSLAPLGERTTFKEKLVSLQGIWPILLLFALVIGGLYGGLFTPIEAGAVGALGAFLFALATRMVTRKQFVEATLGAARICGMLLLILICVYVLGSFLALSRVPLVLAQFVAGLELNRWIIFTGICFMYIVFGMIMNIFPALLLTLPLILPTVYVLGFDPIWFGVMSILLVMIGQITPPVAVVCFAVKGMAKDVPLSTIFKGVLPLWGAMVVGMIILALFPQIATFLVNLVRGG